MHIAYSPMVNNQQCPNGRLCTVKGPNLLGLGDVSVSCMLAKFKNEHTKIPMAVALHQTAQLLFLE